MLKGRARDLQIPVRCHHGRAPPAEHGWLAELAFRAQPSQRSCDGEMNVVKARCDDERQRPGALHHQPAPPAQWA